MKLTLRGDNEHAIAHHECSYRFSKFRHQSRPPRIELLTRTGRVGMPSKGSSQIDIAEPCLSAFGASSVGVLVR